MAKFEEADPRWIVAERTDGTNVNNWHWTEKNCFPWAKERIGQLFTNLQLFEEQGQKICIKEVAHVKGEMHINTRKGKTFHFFELDIEFKFDGQFLGEKADGRIRLPEVSFENDLSEHEIQVTVSKAKDAGKLRELLCSQGVPLVRQQLGVLLDEFKAMKGYLHDSGSPVIKVAGPSAPASSALSPTPSTAKTQEVKPQTTATTSTTAIKFSVDFRARPDDIFAALTDPRRVEAYTQSTVVLEPRNGGQFSLFGGNIQGEFMEVQVNERIVQKWRASHWPEGVYSIVTMQLEAVDGGVRLRLKQTGVPRDEAERTQQAWRENIFERIKRLFGYEPNIAQQEV